MISSFGIALSQNLWHLAITRSIQGLSASCFLSTGVAIVSDIFKLEERGRAMGIYASVSDYIFYMSSNLSLFEI